MAILRVGNSCSFTDDLAEFGGPRSYCEMVSSLSHEFIAARLQFETISSLSEQLVGFPALRHARLGSRSLPNREFQCRWCLQRPF